MLDAIFAMLFSLILRCYYCLRHAMPLFRAAGDYFSLLLISPPLPLILISCHAFRRDAAAIIYCRFPLMLFAATPPLLILFRLLSLCFFIIIVFAMPLP